jgi:hypothetical protein
VWRLFALVVVAGCAKDTCLTGACPAPCSDVAFQCDPQEGGPLYAGRLADAPNPYFLTRGQGGADDILISNGMITAVIARLGAPSDLAPTGGNVIDLGPAGGADDVNIIYQLSGILPDDAFAYRGIEVATTADAARVTVHGTLDGRPDVDIVTHYELRRCDLGLRVRSELFNGSAETQAFTVADAYHWGKRRVAPFAPRAGQGYEAPELELLELSSLWKEQAYGAGAAASDDGPGYGVVACDRERVAGVNDLQISALGTPMTFVEPGDTIVYERLIVTAGEGRGPARAIDAALAARAQMFDDETLQASGRITAGGMPFGGDVRRASVIVYVDGVPASAVVPGDDGRFAATVPRGAIRLDVWSFGRKVAEGTGGEISVPLPATLQATIAIDGVPAWGSIVLHPADDATRTDVTGSFHGRFDECAPWLGPPHGRSPACNRALVDPQGTELEVPAGRYQVFANAGPERTLAMQEVTLVAGEIATLAFALETVPLALPGWISADLHVHGRASFDSAIPDDDRVRSFVAAGVAVIAATDHDTITDYTRVVHELGFDTQVAVMPGIEATQIIPWLDVPGHSVPRVIGHFNFWPLAPGTPVPYDEGIEPGTLFDRMAPLVGPGGIAMLNHPWDEPLFGRDQGYLRAIDFDPREPVGGALLRRPSGGHRNIDWNLIEILNGEGPAQFQTARVLWHALLAQGFIVPGSGNSDSHGLANSQLGWARNWVDAELSVPTFDAELFDQALRAGKSCAGNGIFISVRVGPPPPGRRAFVGLTPHKSSPGDVLEVEVRAAPWVPVEEVRLITSRGTKQLAFGPAILHPGSPFNSAGTIRYHAFLPLAELVDRDDFIVIEAGMPLLFAADLDDDGVPDTSDNNGDGRIDENDVEEDEDTGPLQSPPDPENEFDPRWAITRVIAGAYPQGFANPILIDLDGNGWTAPGLP